MIKFTHHVVADMDESMVQRCVICGFVVSDYRNVMCPAGSPPSRGFDAGSIFVSGGNPRITTIQPPEDYVDCKADPCKIDHSRNS